VVTWPLILLAIPSVLAGYLIGSLVYDNFFSDAITVMPQHDVLAAAHYHGLIGFISHGLMTAPFWLAMAGLVTAWYLYLKRPDLPAKIQHRLMWLWQILDNKYGFDAFNDRVFAGGSRGLGWLFSRVGDRMLIDGLVVNGTARTVGLISRVGRKMQSGYLYHYAFVMIIGVWLLLTWFVV
jgi:NADH-quinone oxidoreductase subunit L